MKLINIFEKILNEYKQIGNVYHFTSIKNAYLIAKSNHLQGADYHSSLQFIQKVTNKKYSFAVSTTRDKNFVNARRKQGENLAIRGVEACFVLNGSKLSNVYKTLPFDDRMVNVDDADIIGHQAEQVWFGNKFDNDKGIKNLSSYTEKIIIDSSIFLKKDKGVEYYKMIVSMAKHGFNIEFTDKNKTLDTLKSTFKSLKPITSSQDLIKNFLNKNGISNYQVQSDGLSVEIFEKIIIDGLNLSKIPFKITTIHGDMYCPENKFKNMKNFPDEILGNFVISENQLVSLEGCPKKVDGDFIISDQNSGKIFSESEISSICKVGGKIYV